MPWFRPIFFIKIVSAVFEIFRKKEEKTHFFIHDYNTWPYSVWSSKKRWVAVGNSVQIKQTDLTFNIFSFPILSSFFFFLISFSFRIEQSLLRNYKEQSHTHTHTHISKILFSLESPLLNYNPNRILLRDDCIKRKPFSITCCFELNISICLSNPQETKITKRKERRRLKRIECLRKWLMYSLFLNQIFTIY